MGKAEAEKIIDSFMFNFINFAKKEAKEMGHTNEEVKDVAKDFIKSHEYKDIRRKVLNILNQATTKE